MRILIHGSPIFASTSHWSLGGLLGILLVALSPGATFGQPPSSDYRSSGGSSSSGYEEEMDSESGYYEGSSGYGSGRPRGPGSASDAMMQSYGSTMSSLLRNIDLNALLAPSTDIPAVEAGPALSTDAEHAYQSGNYPLALELFYGHMASEYEQASVNLQTVAYSKLLRRPVWQTRFGVSFAVRGDLDADPQPIKEGKTTLQQASGGPSGGPPDFGSDNMDDMESMDSSMSDYGSSSGQFNSRKRSQPEMVMLDAEANEELEKYLGLVAKVVAEEFEARYRQGDYGPALITVMEPQPVNQRPRPGDEFTPPPTIKPMSPEVTNALADSPQPRPLWRPGVMYFGEGDSKDVVRDANREHVDVLLHFDIHLKAGRQEYVQNVSRCRLIHVASGKSLGISKSFDNFEAIRLVKTGRSTERDYVTAQLENMFGLLDRSVKAMELPELTPDVAKRRIGTLLSGGQAKSLRTLAEIRLYQVQGLITEQEAEAAFDIVGGEDGLLMMHGPLEERLALARKWAVKAVPKYEPH